jgi:hypothetical protein
MGYSNMPDGLIAKKYLYRGITFEVGMRVRVITNDNFLGVKGTIIGFKEEYGGSGKPVALVKCDEGSKYASGESVFPNYIKEHAPMFMEDIAIISLSEPKPKPKRKINKADYINCKDYGIF